MSARIDVNQIVSRVRSGISEMSYAQRRVFEHRTGIAVEREGRRSGSCGDGRAPAIASSIGELEALYAQDVKTHWR